MAAQRSELRSPSESDPDLEVMPSEDESDSPPSPPAPTWLLRSARHSAARGPSVARGTAQGRVHSASALNERGARQLAAVAAAAAAQAAGPAAQGWSGRASLEGSATASSSPRWHSAATLPSAADAVGPEPAPLTHVLGPSARSAAGAPAVVTVASAQATTRDWRKRVDCADALSTDPQPPQLSSPAQELSSDSAEQELASHAGS